MFETTNVAATAGQGVPQVNPLQTAEQFALTQNLFNQARLFKAQQMAGAASQAAIDPNTGLYDPGKANAFLAQAGPMASVAVPSALASNQTYATGALGQGVTRQAAIQNTLGPLMTAPNIQSKDVAAAMVPLVTNGVISQDTASNVIGGLPSDPKALRSYLADTFGFQNLGAASTLEATTPQAQVTNIGGSLTPVTAPPRIGQNTLEGPPGEGGVPTIQPGGPLAAGPNAVPLTLPPTSEIGQLTYSDAAGVQHTVPISEVFTPTGQVKPNVPGITGPHGEMLVNIGPQATATASALGGGEAQQEVALQTRAAGVPARKTNLTLLGNEADDIKPGPNNAFWAGIGNLAAEYGIQIPFTPTADAVAANQEFNKLSSLVLASQRQAMGNGATDFQTQLAGEVTPNAALSSKGIKNIIGMMQGNEDYINAQYQTWEKVKADKRYAGMPFDQFQAKFNANVNPLVFQAQYADPAQRAKIIKEVGPAKFEAQWKALYNQGLIPENPGG